MVYWTQVVKTHMIFMISFENPENYREGDDQLLIINVTMNFSTDPNVNHWFQWKHDNYHTSLLLFLSYILWCDLLNENASCGVLSVIFYNRLSHKNTMETQRRNLAQGCRKKIKEKISTEKVKQYLKIIVTVKQLYYKRNVCPKTVQEGFQFHGE